MRTSVCVVCGEEMEYVNGKLYCSWECRYKAMKKRKEGIGIGNASLNTFSCKVCGNEFITFNSRQKYCSDNCRKIAGISVSRLKEDERRSVALENKKKPIRKKVSNLKEINRIDALAKAAGMSYGKYVSMLSLREGGV